MKIYELPQQDLLLEADSPEDETAGILVEEVGTKV
jgi:hypothetical protein